MKNIFRFSLMLLMGVALAACSDAQTEEPAAPAGNKLIQVAPAMADFTRATDTAFEQNDEIGLFVLVNEASHIANAKFVWDGSALTADQAYYWHNDEEVAADVLAYYPYNSAWSTAGVEYNFTVNADQSTHAKYTASDLMVAQTTSKPTEQTVSLPFQHLLSKVVVTINNQLGEEIANVWFSEVYGSTKVELGRAVILSPDGSKGTIKAAPTTTVGGEDAWVLILVPQVDVEPKLIVTTVSEKQYTFTLEAPVTFSSGKYSKANITLDAKSVSTSFTPEIEDWVSDNDLNFKQDDEAGEEVVPSYPEELNWNVVGDFNDWTSFDMTYNEGIYTAEPTIYAGQGFKLRLGDDWLDENGSNVPDRGLVWNEETQAYNPYELGVPFAVAQGGANIVVAVSGVYTISYDVVKDMVTVVLKEEIADPEPEPEPEPGQYTIYAHSTDGWTNMNIWAWDDSTNYSGGTWPGVAMTANAKEIDGKTYYGYTMPVEADGKAIYVIFNNGTAQTGDSIEYTLDRDLYFHATAGLAPVLVDITGGEGGGEDSGEDSGDVTPVTKNVLLCGAHNSWDSAAQDFFTYNETLGLYYYTTTLTAYSPFKVVVDGTWLGSSVIRIDAGNFVKLEAIDGGDNLSITSGGTFDFYYDDKNAYLYVMEQGADPTTASMQTVNGAEPVVDAWGLVGKAINDWGNSGNDIKLEYDYDVQMYAAKNVAFTIATSDAGFKIRQYNDSAWSVNYGASASSQPTVLKTGSGEALTKDGRNLEVPAAGTYDFYFDLANKKAYLMNPGEVPATR